MDELEFHAVVLAAIVAGDVTEALRLGANIVQAVAQPCMLKDVPRRFKAP